MAMIKEMPVGGLEVSEEQWETLRREAQEYFDLCKKKMSSKASESMSHVLNNLAVSLDPGQFEAVEKDFPEQKTSFYQEASTSLQCVKRYFALLNDFPAFKEKEEEPGGIGYFTDLMATVHGSEESVDFYEAKLREEKS